MHCKVLQSFWILKLENLIALFLFLLKPIFLNFKFTSGFQDWNFFIGGVLTLVTASLGVVANGISLFVISKG